jgi:hypothetical protein
MYVSRLLPIENKGSVALNRTSGTVLACTTPQGSRTLTIRTGNEISPRANATPSFSPEMMSPATRERLARFVGALEVFNNRADIFLVGIRQVLSLRSFQTA